MDILKYLDSYAFELADLFTESELATGLLGSIGFQLLQDFTEEIETEEDAKWVKSYIKHQLSSITNFAILYKGEAIEVLNILDKNYQIALNNSLYFSADRIARRIDYYTRINNEAPKLDLLKKFIQWSFVDSSQKPRIGTRRVKSSKSPLEKLLKA